jgi:hypothetical protein
MVKEKSNEEVKSAPTPAQTEKKKMSMGTKVVIGIVVVVILAFMIVPMLGAIGFGMLVSKNIKTDGKTVTIGNGKESVKVSADNGQNQVWPAEIPSSVPKFTAGDIKASGKFGTTWSLSISNVTESDFDKYKTTLQSSGWEIVSEVNVEGIKSLSAKKGTLQVGPTYNAGEKALILGISEVNTSDQ